MSPQVTTSQPSNRFTFFGSETSDQAGSNSVAPTSTTSSGFGQSAFGAPSFGGSSSGGFGSVGGTGGGFASIASTSSGGGFGALSSQSQRKEEDHSVPGTSTDTTQGDGEDK